MKIGNPFKRIVKFLKEVKSESKKITWPTFKEAMRYTAIVLIVSLIVAVFLGAVDFVFTTFMKKFIL